MPKYPVDISPEFLSFCGLQALSCKFNCYYILTKDSSLRPQQSLVHGPKALPVKWSGGCLASL